MSQHETIQILQDYIRRLQDLSTPTRNDVRHARYVKYINTFLTELGNERVYLVGSTGENTKLRWSTDGGDSDFVLVSGKTKIPVSSIEPRKGMEDYIWIKSSSQNTSLCNLQYLCPEMLKTVSPKLFTTLRGIYVITTSTSDSIPGRTRRISTTAENSKVGLARVEFEQLQFDENIAPTTVQNLRGMNERDPVFAAYLKHKRRETVVRPADEKLLKRVFNMIASCKVPGSKEDGFGKFLSFAYLVDAALRRSPIGDVEDAEKINPVTFQNKLEMNYEKTSQEMVKATYTRISSKDFVPALCVDGTLLCMIKFVDRVRHAVWPGQKLAEEIFKTDVFVVARLAPVDANLERDFRLSFNLAEIMLVKNFPNTAKQIYIVLKSYLKGVFRKTSMDHKQKNKLRSYHMKTVMFWMCEKKDLEFWEESDTLVALRETILYLQHCLEKEQLEHYFIESNLFIDFMKSDFALLSQCLNEILEFPIRSIEIFFKMDKENIAEVWLTPDEVSHLTYMQKDGGKNKNIDNIEDAMIDILRGFGEASMEESGHSPVKRALLSLIDRFLEDEKKDKSENAAKTNKVRIASNFLHQMATAGGSQSYSSNHASQTLDLVVGMASFFPSCKQVLDGIGGKQGLQHVLQATNDNNSNRDRHERLRSAVARYLDCSDDTEESVACELKQEILTYFVGREGP